MKTQISFYSPFERVFRGSKLEKPRKKSGPKHEDLFQPIDF